MRKYQLGFAQALAKAKRGRVICEPNPAFAEQLKKYEKQLKAKN
jgi:hypothetical protein